MHHAFRDQVLRPREIPVRRADDGLNAVRQRFQKILPAQRCQAAAHENGAGKRVGMVQFAEFVPQDKAAGGGGSIQRAAAHRFHSGVAQGCFPRNDPFHVARDEGYAGFGARLAQAADNVQHVLLFFLPHGAEGGKGGTRLDHRVQQGVGFPMVCPAGGGLHPVELHVVHNVHALFSEQRGKAAGVCLGYGEYGVRAQGTPQRGRGKVARKAAGVHAGVQHGNRHVVFLARCQKPRPELGFHKGYGAGRSHAQGLLHKRGLVKGEVAYLQAEPGAHFTAPAVCLFQHLHPLRRAGSEQQGVVVVFRQVSEQLPHQIGFAAGSSLNPDIRLHSPVGGHHALVQPVAQPRVAAQDRAGKGPERPVCLEKQGVCQCAHAVFSRKA